MALEQISSICGKVLSVPGNDIDTDRIIPARFMKCVTFDGLGEFAFHDERDFARKEGRVHPFEDPSRALATILLTGINFGCGSSREHAPQSLYHWGIRGILAGSFAEIFFGNAITLGMPCMTASEEVRHELDALVAENPQLEVTLDIANLQVRAGENSYPACLPASARQALMQGRWDPIAELLQSEEGALEVARAQGYSG